MAMTIKVDMADYKITNKPNKLTTLGLGSCVGICLYDRLTGIIGMAHIMLPSASSSTDVSNKAKFADTAIPYMLDDMIRMGAAKFNIVAKIAGGAQMFNFSEETDLMKIGLRNVVAVKAMLSSLGIQTLAQDTGGKFGRTIELSSEDGSLLIKTVGRDTKVL